jgi:MoxR-like ATPase
MLDSQQYQHPLIGITQVVSVEELLAAQRAVREIYLNLDIKNYIVSLVTMSRQHPDVYLGASPRGALALYRTAQARDSREYVPDDAALAEATSPPHHRWAPDRTSRPAASSNIEYGTVPGATVCATNPSCKSRNVFTV